MKGKYDELECQLTYSLRNTQQELRESRQMCSHLSLQLQSEKDLRERFETRNVITGEKCDGLKQQIEHLQEQTLHDNSMRREAMMQMDTKDAALRDLQT